MTGKRKIVNIEARSLDIERAIALSEEGDSITFLDLDTGKAVEVKKKEVMRTMSFMDSRPNDFFEEPDCPVSHFGIQAED